jgi:hypothetical protein
MECVCQGSNENCRYCFGSGSVRAKGARQARSTTAKKSASDKQVTEFLAKHPLLHPNPLQPPEGSEAKHRPHQTNGQRHESQAEELCERSFVSAAPVNVRSVHLRASKRGSQIVDVMKVAKDATTPTCPLCHVQFAHHIELRAHMQVGCAKPNAPVFLPPVRYSPARRMTKCSYCDCPVKATNLQRHLGRCPKYLKGHSNPSARKSVQQTKTNKMRAVRPSEQKTHDSVTEHRSLDQRTRYEQVNRRDPIDATKLYAHSFRENGKFGSHPLHDGMDDESGPD